MIIANYSDGRVVPWFSEAEPVPAGFVEVPADLLAEFSSGKIADGAALAKMALAAEAKRPGAVENSVAPAAAPSFPSVTRIPETKRTRA